MFFISIMALGLSLTLLFFLIIRPLESFLIGELSYFGINDVSSRSLLLSLFICSSYLSIYPFLLSESDYSYFISFISIFLMNIGLINLSSMFSKNSDKKPELVVVEYWFLSICGAISYCFLLKSNNSSNSPTSSSRPINLVNIVNNPPKITVVTSTMNRVELTNKLDYGAILGFIYKLSAHAIAPLIIPLNHMSINYFMVTLILKKFQAPTSRAGKKTPAALAIIQLNNKTTTKRDENFYSFIP